MTFGIFRCATANVLMSAASRSGMGVSSVNRHRKELPVRMSLKDKTISLGFRLFLATLIGVHLASFFVNQEEAFAHITPAELSMRTSSALAMMAFGADLPTAPIASGDPALIWMLFGRSRLSLTIACDRYAWGRAASGAAVGVCADSIGGL